MIPLNLLTFVTLSLTLSLTTFHVSAAPNSNSVDKIFKAPLSIPSSYKPLTQSDDSTPFNFIIHLKSKNLKNLESKMLEISNLKTNDESRRWLSKKELKEFLQIDKDVESQLFEFLISNGIEKDDIHFNEMKNQIKVKSDLGKISKIFKSQFINYQVNIGNDIGNGNKGSIFQRTKEYTVPSYISDHVLSISPFTVFQEVKHNIATNEESNNKGMMKKVSKKDLGIESVCDVNGVTPDCLRTLYQTKDHSPSQGNETPDVAVMEYIDQYFDQTDLTNFLKKYRPDASDYRMPVELSNGAINIDLIPSAETMLDTETVVSQIYPLNSTMYAFGNTLTQGDVFQLTFDKFIETPENLRPGVISISYGSEESSMTQDQFDVMCNSAQALNALGSTIVVSSGDYGVNGNGKNENCPNFTPTYPGGCQYILSVGATQDFYPEVAVNQTLAGFYSGAGSSIFAKIPSFQESQVQKYLNKFKIDQSHFQKGGRMFPDISAQGSKYIVELSGLERKVGGTSASAPTIASILSLENDARKSKNLSRIGWPHPILYRNPDAFYDVFSGGSYGCDDEGTIGFPAEKGWDASMGLGTPLFSKLRQVLNA